MRVNCFYPLLLGGFFTIQVRASLRFLTTNATYADIPTSVGPRLGENGTTGNLAEPLFDPQGCTIVDAPCSDWIALVKKGGCSFLTKIRNMQASGAIAVAMGETDSDLSWLTMAAPEYAPDVKIPSVFLASTVFWEISYWLQMENRPMMVLLYVNGDSVFAQYVLKSPLMVIVALLILSAPAIVILCYLLVSYIRARQFKKQQVASVNVVSNLIKKIFYHDKLNENDSESCIICLEDYSDGDELRVLPCNHYYHTNCVDAWLTTQKKECPICRRDITVTNIEDASLLVTNV